MYNPSYAYAGFLDGPAQFANDNKFILMGIGGLLTALPLLFKPLSGLTYFYMIGLPLLGIGGYYTFLQGANAAPGVANALGSGANQGANDLLSFGKTGLDGVWKWAQGYSPYILVGGIGLWFITSKASKKNPIAGPLSLASIAMMLGGGIMTISNIGGLEELPAIGPVLQNLVHPQGQAPLKIPTTGQVTDLAQYARSYATKPDVILPREIITGKSILGSRNPVDDSNHIYSNISDVY